VTAFFSAETHAATSPSRDALTQQSECLSGFQVYDEQGRIWPPGFVSRLCDPDDSTFMGAKNAFASAKATKAREQAAREGRGWANGTLESLAKPDYKPGPVPDLKGKPFKFKPSSIAEKAYIALRDGGPMNTTELRKALFLKDHELKPYLTPAIRAGVILARRVEANMSVFELGRVLEVSA
jgi:hypothetical protein